MSGFLKRTDVDETTSIPFDQEMASKLYNALKKAKMLPFKCSPSRWPEQFRILRSNLTEGEIKSTVEWYVEHLKDEYVPKVQSAKKFRSEYSRISAAMVREGNFLGAGIKPSAQALHIATQSELNWPGTEKQQVPVFVQIGLTSYNQFTAAIRTLYFKLKSESRAKTEQRDGDVNSEDWKETKLVQYIIDTMPGPRDIINTYLKAANWLAWNNPNWNGNIIPLSFRVETNRFQQMMSRLVAERRLDGSDWLPIWKQIQEIMNENTQKGNADKES